MDSASRMSHIRSRSFVRFFHLQRGAALAEALRSGPEVHTLARRGRASRSRAGGRRVWFCAGADERARRRAA